MSATDATNIRSQAGPSGVSYGRRPATRPHHDDDDDEDGLATDDDDDDDDDHGRGGGGGGRAERLARKKAAKRRMLDGRSLTVQIPTVAVPVAPRLRRRLYIQVGVAPTDARVLRCSHGVDVVAMVDLWWFGRHFR